MKWVFKYQQTGDCVSKALLVWLALQAKPEDLQERDDGSGQWLVVPRMLVTKNGDYLSAKLDCDVKQVEAAVKTLQDWKFIKLEDTACKRGHPYPENLYVAPNGVKFCRACGHKKKTAEVAA